MRAVDFYSRSQIEEEEEEEVLSNTQIDNIFGENSLQGTC